MAKQLYGIGELYEKHGSWYGRWRTPTGRKLNRKVGPKRKPGSSEGLTEKQARAVLGDRMREEAGQPLGGDGVTTPTVTVLGRMLEERQRARGCKRSTTEATDYHVRIHLEPFFKTAPIATIDEDEVERFIGWMLKKGMAPKSTCNALSILHSIFDLALRKKLVTYNPVKLVDKPRAGDNADGATIRFITVDELWAVARSVPDDVLGPTESVLYLTGGMTGLRIGELVALRWRDVDWAAGKLRVERSYVRGQYGTPKSRRGRSVPLADPLAQQLDLHFQASAYQGDDDLVFPHPQVGSPLDRSKLLKRFKATCKRAGITKPMRLHDLRHTFGTRMAARGVALRTIQQWMGHSDSKTTEIYAHYSPDAREREMVNDAFGALTDAPVDGVKVMQGGD